MIRFVLALLFATVSSAATSVASAESSRTVEVLRRVQESVVKVYGLGGVAGLEGYQTGVFLEGDNPVVLTVDSPVLDGASVTLIDALGDLCEGRVLGRDPATGLALIGCPKSTTPPAVIDFSIAANPSRGQLLWVLSNAFAIATGDEPVTVQRSRLAAVAPMPLPIGADDSLNRPAIGAPAAGTTVLLLDAVTSNPGAGGGVVIDANGSAVGLLGAECRSPLTGAWISYAIPAATVREAIAQIEQSDRATPAGRRDGTPAIARRSLLELGIGLIPSITARAPAFIEQVTRDSPAAVAGCRADDLIVAVGGLNVGTAEAAAVAINAALSRSDRVELTVLREQRIVNLTIQRVAP